MERKPTLLEVVRQSIRLRHLSYTTEKSYLHWARRKQHVPVVLTRDEVAAVQQKLKSHFQKWLVASLLYGCGMRLSEALRLRVKDIDFG